MAPTSGVERDRRHPHRGKPHEKAVAIGVIGRKTWSLARRFWSKSSTTSIHSCAFSPKARSSACSARLRRSTGMPLGPCWWITVVAGSGARSNPRGGRVHAKPLRSAQGFRDAAGGAGVPGGAPRGFTTGKCSRRPGRSPRFSGRCWSRRWCGAYRGACCTVPRWRCCFDWWSRIRSNTGESTPLAFRFPVIGCFFQVGFVRIALAAARGHTPEFIVIFGGFDRFLPLLAMSLLFYFMVMLGCALDRSRGDSSLSASGFPTFYCVDAGLGPIASLRESWRAMRGHKLALFVFLSCGRPGLPGWNDGVLHRCASCFRPALRRLGDHLHPSLRLRTDSLRDPRNMTMHGFGFPFPARFPGAIVVSMVIGCGGASAGRGCTQRGARKRAERTRDAARRSPGTRPGRREGLRLPRSQQGVRLTRSELPGLAARRGLSRPLPASRIPGATMRLRAALQRQRREGKHALRRAGQATEMRARAAGVHAEGHQRKLPGRLYRCRPQARRVRMRVAVQRAAAR